MKSAWRSEHSTNESYYYCQHHPHNLYWTTEISTAQLRRSSKSEECLPRTEKPGRGARAGLPRTDHRWRLSLMSGHLWLSACSCVLILGAAITIVIIVIIPSNKNRKNLRLLLNQPRCLGSAPGKPIYLFCGVSCHWYLGTPPAWGFWHCRYGFWQDLIS